MSLIPNPSKNKQFFGETFQKVYAVNIICSTKLTSYFTLPLSTILIVEWHSKLSKTVLHNIVKNFWHLCSGCDMGCRTVGLKYTISGPDIK